MAGQGGSEEERKKRKAPRKGKKEKQKERKKREGRVGINNKALGSEDFCLFLVLRELPKASADSRTSASVAQEDAEEDEGGQKLRTI